MRELHVLAVIGALVGLAAAGPLGAQETAAAGDAAAAVAGFHRALAAGDREAALAALDPEVVVFEQGGAEMSRDEYAASHLGADMEFSAGTERRVLDQRAGGAGDVAWVLTRSETAGTFRGSEVRSAGVETMVLEKLDGAWRIVHIHWSGQSQD